MNRRRLICYDIADPRRLQRIHRRIKRDGVAVQYSIFQCDLDDLHFARLVADLKCLVDPRSDDIRIYGPRQDAPVMWIGRPCHAEGIQFFNNPAEADEQLKRMHTPLLHARVISCQGPLYPLEEKGIQGTVGLKTHPV